MTYKSKKSQKGFTLVELAIVLVIIGLIVSGVLVGQDLIKAAELRATVRQYQEFQVATNTFIGKYSYIPGDIDGDKYGLTGGCDSAANGDGDGDGLVESTVGSGGRADYNGEISCFWANLTTSGKELIKGVFDGYSGAVAASANDVVGTNMPQMKFGSYGWGVYTDSTDNWFVTGVPGDDGIIATDDYLTADSFVPLDMFNIDDKIDDGVPSTGDVQAVDNAAADPSTQDLTGATATFANNGAVTTACVDISSSPDAYQFTATSLLCNMKIKMQTF